MNRRENLIRALKRQNPEYVPYCFDLCRSLVETFNKKTGSEDYLEYFDLPTRCVDILPSKHIIDYSGYYQTCPTELISMNGALDIYQGVCTILKKCCIPWSV